MRGRVVEGDQRSPQTRGLEASNQPEGVKGKIQTFTQLAADNSSWPSDRVGGPQVSQLGLGRELWVRQRYGELGICVDIHRHALVGDLGQFQTYTI